MLTYYQTERGFPGNTQEAERNLWSKSICFGATEQHPQQRLSAAGAFTKKLSPWKLTVEQRTTLIFLCSMLTSTVGKVYELAIVL